MHKSKVLLGSFCALALSMSFTTQAKTFVYVSNSDSGKLSHYKLSEKDGKLKFMDEIEAGAKVMPTAVSPDKEYLYAATRKSPFGLVSWKIDPKTGNLTDKQVSPIEHSYAYIATDNDGKYLLGASYGQDVVVSYAIKDGILSEKPVSVYKTGPHAHSVIVDKTNKNLYVGNLGADKVLQLSLSDKGEITALGDGGVATAKNDGPRHSVISPDNRFVYNIGEMGGIITQYQRDDEGNLTKISETPSAVAKKYKLEEGKERPDGYSDPTPRIWASDIKITPDGRFIFVSERTSSTVAGYKVDKKTGKLTLTGIREVEKQPRGIAVSPSGKWLIVTGEKSNQISAYKIDGKSGMLSFASRVPASNEKTAQDANWVSVVSF